MSNLYELQLERQQQVDAISTTLCDMGVEKSKTGKYCFYYHAYTSQPVYENPLMAMCGLCQHIENELMTYKESTY